MASTSRRPASSRFLRAHISVHPRDRTGLPLARLEQLAQLIDEIGEPCWAAGSTAAALHQFDGFVLRPPFHILVPRARGVRRAAHVIHTTRLIDALDRESMLGIPVTSPSRTLLHLAATEPIDRVTSALDGAIRDGLTTDDFLHRRIAVWRTCGRNGVRPLIAAIDGFEITRGGHSWLEREFLRLLADGGLPHPETQAVLGRRGDRLIRVDARFPGTNLLVEVLGYRWHRTKPQLTSDAQRLNRLQLDGFLVIQFTYPQVVEQPERVLADVREALAKAGPRTG